MILKLKKIYKHVNIKNRLEALKKMFFLSFNLKHNQILVCKQNYQKEKNNEMLTIRKNANKIKRASNRNIRVIRWQTNMFTLINSWCRTWNTATFAPMRSPPSSASRTCIYLAKRAVAACNTLYSYILTTGGYIFVCVLFCY